MITMPTIIGFNTSTLLSYYSAQISLNLANTATPSAASPASSSSSASSATADDITPWNVTQPSQQVRDAEVLSSTSFLDTSNVPLTSGVTTGTKTEQDNQKLFSLYNAVNDLSYLASMSTRSDVTEGQMEGYNTRFQTELTEVENYISSTTFNDFTLQEKQPSASVTSTATVPNATFDYTGSVLANGDTVSSALSGLSKSDSFTITIQKGGVSNDVNIDLSKVDGDLTLGNIVSYVNQTLAGDGYSTRFQKVLTAGSIDAETPDAISDQQYAIEVDPGGTEEVSLSAASSPALYFSSTSGSTTSTTTLSSTSSTLTTTPADNQGRLVKLSDLDDPKASFSRNTDASTGTTTASSTVVDSSGNVYVLGNATGNLGSQLNQGSQDVYLTKYNSSGAVSWSQLVGSAGSADGAAMALNPDGGVTIVGATTAQLTTSAINDGNQDSFAVKYDAYGNQVWATQIPTLNSNTATSVSVDASGNVYIGGQSTGVIGAGETKDGGQDAYLAKLSSSGKITAENLFGTTGSDTVSATAVTSSGDLLVASMQNGDAILSKYAGGNISAAPTWQMDMGALQAGGTIGGIAVNGDQIYVSGTTSNVSLNATTAASSDDSMVAGGTSAFLFSATDNGSSATANHVSYIGTSAGDKGSGIAVGSDGTVYLTGSTTGTFAGQDRNSADTTNAFVAALDASGSVNWLRQYGGADGQSVGTGIAFDPTGSSVLDALGLPSGAISGKQNSYLANATTLRAGDSFSVEIEGNASRTFNITIDPDETLTTLATKLNGELGSNGTASVSYTSSGAALKIAVSNGVTAKLISGPTDSDALARLGVAAQTLSNTTASSTSSSSSTSTSNQSFALGMPSNLDISNATDASMARTQLLGVLNTIQSIYQTTNTPASSTSTAASPSSSSDATSAAQAAYLNNLNNDASVALSLLTT